MPILVVMESLAPKTLALALCIVLCLGELKLQVKDQDVAGTMGYSQSLDCILVDGDDRVITNLNGAPAFHVKWTFQPAGTSALKEVLTITNGGRVVQDWSLDSSKYKQGKGLQLIVENLNEDDAGTYTCLLLDNNMKQVMELYVVGKVQCQNEQENHVFVLHEEVKMDCVVSYHGSKPPELRWKHDQNLLSQTTVQHNKTTIVSKLRFNATMDTDGHVYICYVEYPGAYLTYCTTSPLHVKYPVRITNVQVSSVPESAHEFYQEGSDIYLNCHARGDPIPSFLWTFIPQDISKRHRNVSTSRNLLLRSVKMKDAGSYVCRASNEVDGMAYFKEETVHVSVTTRKEEVHVRYGYLQEDAGSVQDFVQLPGQVISTASPVIETEISPYKVGAIATAALAIILIMVFVLLAIRVRAKDKKLRERFSRTHDEFLDDQEVELLDDNIQPEGVEEPSQYNQLRQCWEIPRKDIRLVEMVARGTFTEVWKGKIKKNGSSDGVLKVAVKKLAEDSTERDRKFFLAEMEVSKVIKPHVNIIQLIGCYTMHEPWLIMQEFAHEGTLYDFLLKSCPGNQEVEISNMSSKSSVRLKNYNINSHRLLSLGAQIVNGLEHITKFKLVSYRLRSRNILVTKSGICKLAGFGFPRDVTERNQYEAESKCERWMAPESITDDVYSTMSDVWAFGVVLWEILHFGAEPYPMIGDEVAQRVLEGYRMPQPVHISCEMHEVMSRCWQKEPGNRPPYSKLMTDLSNLAVNDTAHIHLDKLPSFVTQSFHSSTDDEDAL